jgi:SAM-dependent methyltransferase
VTTASARSSDDPDKMQLEHYSPEGMIRRLLGSIFPDGLQGRSFLDCACNSGGHSIAAARMGAGRSFAFDARQHWIDQCEFLARTVPVPRLTCRRCTLADIPALGLEPFDVTLFSGIFYHLPDPVAGLRIAADLTREILIVNTAVLPRRDKALMLVRESLTHHLSGVDGLAWAPTGPEVMKDILAWCGFAHVRVDLYWTNGPPGWKRLQTIAAREAGALDAYDRRRPDATAPPTLRRRALGRMRRLLRR